MEAETNESGTRIIPPEIDSDDHVDGDEDQDARREIEKLAPIDLAEEARVLEGIRQGLEDMRAGLGRPADEVFADIRRDLGIDRDA